jgi:hypothetical protein
MMNATVRGTKPVEALAADESGSWLT